MLGLVAYDDDDDSESEGIPTQSTNDNNYPKNAQKQSAESRRTLKSQVIIKRTANHHARLHGNRHSAAAAGEKHDHDDDGRPLYSDASARFVPEVKPPSDPHHASVREESSRIREILKPPSIPELEDWGIPPKAPGICDPALQSKLAQFCSLKQDSSNPKHFNDSLMANRSFRNPHLYAKLVEFVEVNERITNFPKDLWDPGDLRPEWFADRMAEAQKERDEKQASGKRTRIDFSTPTDKERLSKKGRLYGYGSVGSSGLVGVPNRQRMRLG